MSTESSTGIQSAEIALDVLTRLAELGGAVSVSEPVSYTHLTLPTTPYV